MIEKTNFAKLSHQNQSTDYCYYFLHYIEAEVRVFRKPRKTLVNDCFITHAAKQFFVDVIEYYDHKCYVCSYAVKAKIRIVLLVNQNEDRNTTTQLLLGTNIILEQ